MSYFEELIFDTDENGEISATVTYETGVGARVVRELDSTPVFSETSLQLIKLLDEAGEDPNAFRPNPQPPLYPYRIHLLRNGKPISPDDSLQKIAKRINFMHGETGVTCVLVGLEFEE